MTSDDTEDILGLYQHRRSLYVSFATRIEMLMRELLSDAHVDVIQTESRAKTVVSLGEKLKRKNAKYTQLGDVPDLVGIRVITYYLEDLDVVERIIRENFEVDQNESSRRDDALQPDQFGYLSAHYVVQLNKLRAALPEWRAFSEMKVEIQVRTALQHAWAAVNHKLDYKSELEAPRELRRSLFRLSALFELADEQFSRLRVDRRALDAANVEAVLHGQLGQRIDASSLNAYLETSPNVAEIKALLEQSGIPVLVPPQEAPKLEMRLQRDRADLMKALAALGFETMQDFDDFISDREWFKKTIDARYGSRGSNDWAPAALDDILTLCLILAERDNEKARTTYEEIYVKDNWPGIESDRARFVRSDRSGD